MTDDLISRAAALKTANIIGQGDCPDSVAYDVVDAIRALPAVAASQPNDPAVKPNSCQQMRVKPLVWFPASGNEKLCNDHWMASAFCGAYHMSPDEDSCCGTWLLQWTLRASDFCMKYGGEITIHSGPEAAKAAAQADYEQRILAAIETQPDPQCCFGLTAMDCADVPSRHCAGLQPDPRDAVIAGLVEALQELTTCVEDGCFCSEMKIATAIDVAHAAIAAAKGGAA